MKRRSFLNLTVASPLTLAAGTALGLAGSTLASSAWAAPASTDARFLLVFLRGGYDAMSLLVPSGSDFYRQVRPNIAIPVATAGAAGATPLNSDWALHPALNNTLLPLARKGQAVFIPFAGTDDVSRSHFETQDSIELGQSLEGRRDFRSGFLNRLAAQIGASNAISFTDRLPVCLRGSAEVANVSLKGVPRAGNAQAQQSQAAIAAMYQGTPLQSRVAEAFTVREEVAREMAGMESEMEAANRGAITAKGFELEARRMARLMRDRYALGFIDVGGWDTHVNQGAGTGYLASRFEELGQGLAVFANEVGEATWRKTVVVVVSEFGRTARENGNRGTDHGHGSVYWVLGGGLTGSPVAGEQRRFEAATLFQNRDLPVLNEYRAVLGGLLRRQYGLSSDALGQVFAGVTPRDLGIV